MKKLLLIFLFIMSLASAKSQDKPSVVKSVDLDKYKGLWYEIARLPNRFEKKLKCVTATYTLRDDGRITVLNKGHDLKDPALVSSSEGVAWVPDKNSPAKLKVRFFWPFTGDYWIMELDKNYKYVLIGEPKLRYLWILSRENKLDEKTYNMLLSKAISNGYDVKPIIKIDQDCK